MPKISKLQTSFNSGEISPILYGRTDSERYTAGLQTCLNYIPTLQGPLIRRPGTKYVNNVKDGGNPGALIPFTFSLTQAYILEFGNQYIRFFANGGSVITSSNSFQVSGSTDSGENFFFGTRPNYQTKPNEIIIASSIFAPGTYEVPSPYLVADVRNIKFAQNQDVLYLFHPNYPTFKLERFDQTDWRLKQVYFQDGPYLNLNSYSQTGDSTGIWLTPKANSGLTTLITGPQAFCSSIISNASGNIRVITTNPTTYTNGQRVVIKGVVGATEANTFTLSNSSAPNYWTIKVIATNIFDLEGSTFTSAYTGSGIIYPSLFTGSQDVGRVVGLIPNGQRGWGVITSYLGDNSSVGFWIDASNSAGVVSQSTAQIWQMGVFGGQIINGGTLGVSGPIGSSNYPSCGCFHQDRLMLAGSPNYPQKVVGSMSSTYETFSPSNGSSLSVADNNALSFNLNSQDSNPTFWLKSTAQGLLAGTKASEWTITPSSQASALTPTNFNALQTSFFGSFNADATQAASAVVHLQRASRKVRELNYFFQFGTYRSTDLTELSEHITLPSVTKLVTQKESQPLVWGLRSDGNLVSMVYNRDDVALKAGWSRHQLGGQSDFAGTNPIVLSMAVIPSQDTTYDQVWLMVERATLLNSTFVSIEYMTKPFDDLALQADAFQGDCGATYDNPLAISTVTFNGVFAAVIISNNHGLNNLDQVRINSVDGISKKSTDAFGNFVVTSAINDQVYIVASSTTNNFCLNDFSNKTISFTGQDPYVSGGQVRKMVQTISGLNWLVGDTIGVLADGSPHPDVVVIGSGTVTLNYRAAKVQLGYRFNSDGQTLRVEGGSGDGSSIGQTRRVTRVAAQMHRMGDFNMGATFTDLVPVQFEQADVQTADQATPLFSGMHRDSIGAPYDFEGYVCFRQNSMLPGMVQSLTILMEEQDV